MMEQGRPAPRMESPYARAVLELMARIGRSLPPGTPTVRAVLVGGAAAHLHTGVRVSDDVEAIYSARLILPQDLTISYSDASGQPHLVVYDYNYASAIGLLHPDAEADAQPLGIQVGALALHVLSPVDLAVSKLARLQDHDRQDILALAQAGLLDAESLRQRAEEALGYYVGEARWVRDNLDDAVALVGSVRARTVP
jgi:hypothetical protein